MPPLSFFTLTVYIPLNGFFCGISSNMIVQVNSRGNVSPGFGQSGPIVLVYPGSSLGAGP